MVAGHHEITNRILRSLDREALKRLEPSLQAVKLPHGRTISQVAEKVDYVYFINRGMVSLVETTQDGRVVEVALIGPDGVTNPFVLNIADTASIDTVVQIPASALQIPRETLLDEISRNKLLDRVLRDYAQYMIRHLARTAACNRLHSIMQRSCRWLLSARDSALSDSFYLTHEFLAEMLGVQRSGVTVAALELGDLGMISYRHGRVSVLDVLGLEQRTCECYFANREDLDSVFDQASSDDPDHN